MAELILEDETYAVPGAAIEVHRALGPGFLEKVYQEAMQLELSARRIPFEAEKPIGIEYKGQYPLPSDTMPIWFAMSRLSLR